MLVCDWSSSRICPCEEVLFAVVGLLLPLLMLWHCIVLFGCDSDADLNCAMQAQKEPEGKNAKGKNF